MTIQKISGVGLNQNVTANKNLALPQELSHDSFKQSKVSFKSSGCSTAAAATSAAACISLGIGTVC